jgi:imidazoleglycerol-phosphate dehydratase
LRKTFCSRKTKETDVSVYLNLDGNGEAECDTGIRMLDHMITTFSLHSSFDIKLRAKGDLIHHIVEDTAIVLGKAIDKALDKREGIARFGYAIIPMDDALSYSAVDLVKRSYVKLRLDIKNNKIEDLVSEDIEHFISSLVLNGNFTLHLSVLEGENDHHKLESCFKALAISLRDASRLEKRRNKVVSTKGVL